MSIDFELYDEVISDFVLPFPFTRFIKTNDGKGRQVLTPIVPPTTIECYIHPATDQDITDQARDGYRIEDMIKIFAQVDADILSDDEVLYRSKNYRVMKDNIKVVGDYSKFFAELVAVA